MPTCQGCGAGNPDRAKFCLECGTALALATPTGEVRKTVTLLFCDVTGSTALGERLDPEAMRAVMSRYFETARQVIEAHGGTVEKFIGDAVMAVFGVPVLHEDDALRALRAALGIRDGLTGLNDILERDHGVRLEVRIGVNTGEVVVGTGPGTGARGTVATGDAVNVAARLQSAAEPGEVLLGGSTWTLVRTGARAEPIDPLTLKGKVGPVTAWRLLDVADRAGSQPAERDTGRRSPLVGRDHEVALLRQTYDRCATDRRSQLVTVLGAAGVGKTRLATEVLAELAGGAALLRGRCLSYGEDIAFFPLRQMLREVTGLDSGALVDDAHDRLRAVLGEGPDTDLVVRRLAPMAGLAGTPAGAEDTHWAVRRLVEALGRDRPVVLVLDDVHWAQPAMLDVVDHLADWTRGTALMLVCLARPEFLDDRPHWGGGKLNATTVLLEPLGDGAAGELLANLVADSAIDEGTRARILAAAGGTPLFVEQMLAMMVDEGVLARDAQGRHRGSLAAVEIPPTISALLAARLDRLPPDERATLEAAAVMGLTFYRDAVSELSDTDVGPALLALTRKELVRPDRSDLPGQDAFRFLHVLVRDAAYAAMSKVRRADTHERFATWLDKHQHDTAGDADEFVAHHLDQAVRLRAELGPVDAATRELAQRAAAKFAAAAQRLALADPESSGSLSERAADLLEQGDPMRVDHLRSAAAAREEVGDFAGCRQRYEQARELAVALGDARRARLCEIDLMGLATQLDPTIDAATALEEVTALLDGFRQAGDDEGVIRAGLARLALLNLHALSGPMAELAAELLEVCERTGDLRVRASLQMTVGAALFHGPAPIQQLLYWIETSPVELSRTTTVGRAFFYAAALAYVDRVADARAALARAEHLLGEHSTPIAQTYSGFGGATAYLELGEPAEAERLLRAGADALSSVGEQGWLSTMVLILGEVRRLRADPQEARSLAERGRTLSHPKDHGSQAQWRALLARLEAHEGRFDLAVPLADEAVEQLVDTDDINNEAAVRVARAEVLASAGRHDDAVADLRAALALYDRKGNRPRVRQVRDRLAALAAAAG